MEGASPEEGDDPNSCFFFFIALTSGLEIDNQCILQQTLKNITILYDLNIKSWFFEIEIEIS
jgi:hypothetical protein